MCEMDLRRDEVYCMEAQAVYEWFEGIGHRCRGVWVDYEH
jgi:hypothetical protein